MTLTRKEVKLIVSLERQIDNHGIERIAVVTSASNLLKFDANRGWTLEEAA